MSLFQKLFNRKRSTPDEDEILEEEDYLESEDEDGRESEFSVDQEREAEEQEDDEEYEVVEREIHPAKIICPDCAGITLEGLEFCDKCGGELL